MNIDKRDIKKGALSEILPEFQTNSISYLSELNDYRMYAETWSNSRAKVGEKRSEIGHTGYLKTLESGEKGKKRKSDKVRFDYFVVANSINYNRVKNIYGEQDTYIQIGGVQNNTIFNDIIKAGISPATQTLLPDTVFHSNCYLPQTVSFDLKKLDLRRDKKSNKHYFEIPTKVDNISNENQKIFLLHVLGKRDIYKKLHLLNTVDRTHIRCLFENPSNIRDNIGATNVIPRFCVAWPFNETLVFDFAGVPEDYGEVCVLGTHLKMKKVRVENEICHDKPQIDSYA
ncbi:MAG: hypothetical protein GY777_06050 [Candidatus Brocadiaceae bacterium]|nr:hypothetical protein [Candidatus Brocadiaceae bacterium]